jgi:hypothetical protein
MYTIKMDNIFVEYAKTFNASMLSLWGVSQPFFLDWAEQQRPPIMQLEAKSGKPSAVSIKLLVAEIRKNNLPDNKKGPFFTELIQNYCAIFCVASFDRLQEDPRYKKIENKPAIQFFRHIRNGCSHGNKFFFKTYTDKKTGKKMQEPTKLAQFRGLTIDRKLMGKKVFFDFLSTGDIPYLIEDVSKELINTENN